METNHAARKQLRTVKFTDYHTHHRDDNSKIEAIKKMATETISRARNMTNTVLLWDDMTENNRHFIQQSHKLSLIQSRIPSHI